jgi:hypothetical protein
MSSWRTLRAVAVAFSLCLPGAVLAQNQTGAAPPAPPQVPDELVERVLAGDATALTDVRNFLTTGTRSPEEVTQRATALISKIGAQKGNVGAETLLRVIDRIASNAINLVAGAKIVKLGVDSGFTPRRAVVALDFGPADSATQNGFEKVQPGDPRIAGNKLNALRRPLESELLGGGISGIERIEVDVPDGEYRVILMTQDLGDQSLMVNPFGQEVIVNGSAVSLGSVPAGDWVGESILSNRGSQMIQTQGAPGAPGNAFGRGFLSGDLTGVGQTVQQQQGGALIMPAVARGGKLIIELRGGQSAASYLTGLMVEPANETSDLVLNREAERALVPPELRLALEENILAAAASVLADIDPAAGDSELVELPEPILDPEENASISSWRATRRGRPALNADRST